MSVLSGILHDLIMEKWCGTKMGSPSTQSCDWREHARIVSAGGSSTMEEIKCVKTVEESMAALIIWSLQIVGFRPSVFVALAISASFTLTNALVDGVVKSLKFLKRLGDWFSWKLTRRKSTETSRRAATELSSTKYSEM
jgi:hypothetical protein